MKLKIYQVDAFANKIFTGNPAAVCPIESWLPESTMQAIAEENNLAETAFFVAEGDGYRIRWFTPVAEVDLCGHATLASAHVLFQHLGYQNDEIEFQSNSGLLRVTRRNELLELDFPSQMPSESEQGNRISEALGVDIESCYEGEDYLIVVSGQDVLLSIEPDFRALKELDRRGVIVTALGLEHDFVARFFAPKYGIDEDPVTGSAYTQLTPYWSQRTGKTSFSAKQMSSRGGELLCRQEGERVKIAGHAHTYMQGVIRL